MDEASRSSEQDRVLPRIWYLVCQFLRLETIHSPQKKISITL